MNPAVRHRDDRAPAAAVRDAATPASISAKLGEVQAAGANAGAVAQILEAASPRECDEILKWLHQHHGNQFVQQVLAQSKDVKLAASALLAATDRWGTDEKAVYAALKGKS